MLAAVWSTASDMLDIVNRPPAPKWNWSVSKDGELAIDVAGVRYTQQLRYSYPQMKENAWNTLPGKNAVVTRKGKSAVIALKTVFYTVTVKITEKKNRLFVQETIANTTDKDLAVAFDMFIRSNVSFEPHEILLAGIFKGPSHNDPHSPPQNSTLFFGNGKNGLGVFLEDDFYRLQQSLKRGENCAIVENRSFGLPPKKSYTFEYSFFPVGKGDYYDFINTVRRHRKVNTFMDGNLVLASNPHPQLCSAGTSAKQEIYRQMQEHLGMKYVSATAGIWLGNTNFYSVPGSRRFMKAYKNLDHYLSLIRAARRNAAKVSPELKIFSMLQTVFCAPPQLPGKPIPFADSVIIEADGKAKGYPVHEMTRVPGSKKWNKGKLLGYVRNYYPMIGNSYYKHLCDLIDKAMEAGAQGIYFDTFSYAYWSKYGRWTYDRWDGHSVDIDTKTWTIARKKADLPILVASAQNAMFDRVIKRGGFVAYNHTPATREQEKMLRKAMSFTEARGPGLAQQRHLSHPTTLGYFPGYVYLQNEWKTPRGMFLNIMENLDWGCLTYVYWPANRIPVNSIARHQFPITIRNIYAGCVEGEDRIITNRSGVYTLRDSDRPQVFIYGPDGVERSPKAGEALFSMKNGISIVTLKLPAGGAAVLRKGKTVAETLSDELEVR